MQQPFGEKQLTKCDYVARELKNRIVSGQYKQGYQLPPEPELCQMFGVSRITIREALKKLNMMGLVDIHQGKGTFVRPVDLSLFMRPLLQKIRFEDIDVAAIYDAREYVEGGIAYQAALNATDADMESLGKTIQNLRRYIENDDDIRRGSADRQFHAELARICRNPILLACYQTLDDLSTACVKRKSKHAKPMENCFAEHNAVFEAVRRKDPEAARAAMELHARNSKNYLLSASEQTPKINK